MSRRLPGLFRSVFLLFIFVLSLGHFDGPIYSAEPAPLVPCTGTIRIMPLGDSITKGSASGVTDETLQISYRKDLYDSLDASYDSVDFVGSLTNGQNVPNFDPNHEGHAGWTDTQIAANIYNWLVNLGPDWPHIILLHIGTNDPNESANDVENILNAIDDYEDPDTGTGNQITVILALIIDNEDHNQIITNFNNNVETMALGRTNDDIFIVDMENDAGLVYELQENGGDFYDNLHPYANGYTKMAAVWENAVNSVFESCNNPPSIDDPGPQTSAEGSSPSLEIQADPGEAGQTLTFSQTGLPPDLSIDPLTGVITGSISYDAVIGSPDQVYDVKVTVEDNGVPARSSFVNFHWTVTNTNRPPNASDDGYSITEGEPLEEPPPGVLDNDSDPDGSPPTEAALVSSPDHGGLSLSANGSFVYTPDPDFSGVDTFTYRAIDEEDAQSNVATVTITVENVNDAPVAQNQSLATAEDVPLPVILLVDDPDTGDVLSYTILNQPDHGTLSGAAPNLTYTPDLNYSGPDSFTFKANDGTIDSNQAIVSITVNPVNDLEVTNPGSQISNEEESISLRIQVVDAEGDNLSFQVSGTPPGLSIDENTGLISGKINAGASHGSPYLVTVTVSDGNDSVPVTFSWFVDEKTWLFLPMVTTK